MLEIRGLHVGYDTHEIVHGASFQVESGQFACILGANGCGKTTTLKAILGILRPSSGDVLMDGASTIRLHEAECARLFAYIPQTHTPPFPFTVRDVVALGRTPYLGQFNRMGATDEAIVNECMERMGVDIWSDRPYTELSGGQQQLALIARALAQQPQLLIMDEPTASLDFGNQQLVLRQVRQLTEDGMGVLMVTHDPSHALACAHHVVIMEAGTVTAEGTPRDVVDTACLERIYHADVQVMDVQVPKGIQRVCVPLIGETLT